MDNKGDEAAEEEVPTLSALADALKRGNNSQAAGRVRSLEAALKEGKVAIWENTAYLVLAEVIPAWWLEREDVLEIAVVFFGQSTGRQSIVLVAEGERRLVLEPSSDYFRVSPVREGLWLHRYTMYVDSEWNWIKDERLLVPEDSSGIARLKTCRRYEELQANTMHWDVQVGDDSIPLVIGDRPCASATDTEGGGGLE